MLERMSVRMRALKRADMCRARTEHTTGGDTCSQSRDHDTSDTNGQLEL